MRLGNVMTITAATAPEQFTVDSRTASLGVLQFFKHNRPASLGHHEPATVGVEGFAGRSRVVIVDGQCPHSCKAADYQGSQRSFGPACNHEIGIVVLDGLKCLSDCIRAARAGGDDGPADRAGQNGC